MTGFPEVHRCDCYDTFGEPKPGCIFHRTGTTPSPACLERWERYSNAQALEPECNPSVCLGED